MSLFGEDNIELSEQQRIDWLRLIRTENIGPVTFRRLINRFGSAAKALDALPHLLQNGGGTKPLKAPSMSEIEDELAAMEKIGAKIVTALDKDYPALLRHIHSSPPVFTMIGGEKINYQKTIAMVGARNSSAAGIRMTSLLAGELSENNYCVVSGLARGIDSAAHRASLEGGTLAVLAGGINNIYPNENIKLAEEIIAHGGAIISEMPLNYEPRAKDFPRRNRIISGISLGVIVIEAAKRSGSLITAKFALEQNREIFAVPGSPLDERSSGANHLIKQGATLVSCAQDVMEQLENYSPIQKNLFEEDDLFLTQQEANISEPNDDDRSKLLNALSITPIRVDELIQQSKLSTPIVQTILLELDIAGKIEWASGQLVSLK